MGSQYNGNSGNISRVIFYNITSSTNASPIVLQVNGHGLTTDDSVIIGSHQVNTAANGRWLVTVIDANHVALQGSTGNGVGGATGQLYPETLGATYQIPSDLTDDMTAASVNVAFEALGDRTAYLGRQVAVNGAQVATLAYTTENDNTPSYASWGTITGNVLGAAWKPLMVGGVQLLWNIDNLTNADTVEFTFTTSGSQNFNANALIAFWYQQVAPGNAWGSGAGPSKVQGSGQLLPWSGANPTGLALHGFRQCGGFGASSDPGGRLIVGVQAFMPNSGADVITFFSDYMFMAKVLRQNG